MSYRNNIPTALELELDGNPEEHSAALVVRLLAHLKSLVIRAMEDKAGSTERGRILRRTATIRIYIGTTGRVLSFGPPKPDEDELRQLQAWRGVVSECLDTLSLAISFGHFMADMEAVFGLPDDEQSAAKADMVHQVQKQGGLMWDRRKMNLKTVGKVFKDWKGNCLLFQGWVAEVNEADEKARAQPLASIEEVAMQLASGLDTVVGDPRPTVEELREETGRVQRAAEEARIRLEAEKAELAAAQQEARLETVGAPNVVSEAAPVSEVTKLLAGMSQEEIAKLVEAARQMQAQGADNQA
jgi:hypothetical protein